MTSKNLPKSKYYYFISGDDLGKRKKSNYYPHTSFRFLFLIIMGNWVLSSEFWEKSGIATPFGPAMTTPEMMAAPGQNLGANIGKTNEKVV